MLHIALNSKFFNDCRRSFTAVITTGFTKDVMGAVSSTLLAMNSVDGYGRFFGNNVSLCGNKVVS